MQYGEVDVGAQNDVKRAHDIIERFVDNYATCGFVYFGENSHSSNDLVSRKEFQIGAELERYYKQTRQLLVRNREFLDKLACALVDKKTLVNKGVQDIKRTCNIVV